ncbi:MAG: class I SAM-dependent methyltransferase [Gammaproteobacteria bacterium]|nr:class I SAM-dependent methyltransferase [Gammaproteobacteria bacterium]
MMKSICEAPGVRTEPRLAKPVCKGIAVMTGFDDSCDRTAAKLAGRLKLPLVTADTAQSFSYLLVVTPKRLELRENRRGMTRPICVDTTVFRRRRSTLNLSRRQPLARAIGPHTNTVVDATAGIGQDAFLLALMGYRVTAIERSAIIAALLQDGVSRAGDSLAGRVDVIFGDTREVLPSMRPAPDTVYLDPMFPPKRKRSALAKKSVRTLRDLVGDDDDAVELLAVCLRHAANRVVVKRPSYADPLKPAPSANHRGKLVRYDVYFVKP